MHIVHVFPVLVQVLLGEVNAGLNTTQVVVKELKVSASVPDQMHFLEEVQPYRYMLSLSFCHVVTYTFTEVLSVNYYQFANKNSTPTCHNHQVKTNDSGLFCTVPQTVRTDQILKVKEVHNAMCHFILDAHKEKLMI